MRSRICSLLFLFYFNGEVCSAQEQYIKYFTQPNNSNRVRVISSAIDNDYVVFALDSSVVYKIGICGNVLWSKKLSVSLGTYNYADVTSLTDGSFVLLLRSPSGNHNAMQLLKLSSTGNVLWSKAFSLNNYDMYPYTITQDAQGHLIMYGNITYQNLSPNYNMLTKLDVNGNIIWSKGYNLGMIWGGCLNTSDGGYLMRTSSTFIKTDGSGNVQWISHFGVTAYNYYAPVEVSDGYVFSGRTNTGNQLYFYKMDKQGNFLWNNIKVTNIVDAPHLLHSKPNGNFVTVYNESSNGKAHCGIVEFDKDVNVVSVNLLQPSGIASDYLAGDICFTKNGNPVITGRAAINGDKHVYIAKTNSIYQSSCDTSFNINFTTDTIFEFQTTINTTDFTPVVTPITVNSVDLNEQTNFICFNPSTLTLQLNNNPIICNGNSVVLQNTSSSTFTNYLWSTGEITPSITAIDTGVYVLTVTGNCSQDTLTDSVYVSALTIQSPPQLKDTTLCDKESILLDATTANASYVWNDGSTNATLSATQGGNYFVDITVQSCTRRVEINVDECEVLTMPNIFTPNGDDYNNTFVPIKMLGIRNAALYLFNRWGQKIYTTSDIKNKGWDGKHRGKKSSDGVYFWVIDYENYRGIKKNQHGNVHLVGN